MVEWWFYVVAIFAAALLVNGFPHFTNGISGRQFPTAFSGGPGTLDTPLRNVLWGSSNLIVGGFLLWLIRDGLSNAGLLIELLVVGVAFAALLGAAFGNPERFGRKR
jgi:hypothetical protein